jgi:colicin import membrane protein
MNDLTLDTTTAAPAIEGSLVNAEKISSDFVETAKAFVIDSPELAAIAGDDLKEIARRLKAMEEERMSFTRPLDEVKKRLMDKYRPYIERLQQADSILRTGLLGWQRKERDRIAELQRIEQARLDEERRELEKKLEKAKPPAKVAELEQKLQEADIAPRQGIAPAIKVQGVSTRQRWKLASVDKLALVKAAAENPKLLMYLLVDESAINKVAVAMGENTDIPGVTVEAVDSLAVRR